MKTTFIALFFFLLFNKNAFAQKDTATYYLTASGKQVPTKEEGELFIKICPPEPGGNPKLFVVDGYYNNGSKLFHTYSLTSTFPLRLQGNYVTYAKNGNKMSQRNFEDGEIMGEQVLYYPNGMLYHKISKEIRMTDTTIFYKECRDSTGKALTENGNGTWITYNEGLSRVEEKGKVLNGLKDSVWTVTGGTNVSYFITYKDGKEIADSMTNKIFTSVEIVPEFAGGIEGFMNFIAQHVRYPVSAREGNIQGRVIISFVVEKNGSLSNVEVQRGIGGGCDEEAVRVIKLSPAWRPGLQNGRPVRVEYSVPISFTLAHD